MATSKKKATLETAPPKLHAWSGRPDTAAVEAHVDAFFAAIRAKTLDLAFALCPHADSSYPFVKTPDKKSIAAAFKLLRRVLTDNRVVELNDDNWHVRLAVKGIRIDAADNVYAKITLDGEPTPLTGLFKLTEMDGRWQLGFDMLRKLAAGISEAGT